MDDATLLHTISANAIDLCVKYDSLSFIRAMTLAALFWSLLLIPSAILFSRASTSYRSLSQPMRGEWLSRIVSDIHATILMPALYYAVFMDNSLGESNGVVWEHRWIVRVVLKVALGYFLYDLLLVLVLFRTISGPVATVVHHSVVVGTIAYVFVLDYPLVYIWAAGLLFTEMSTPFVNQRWFLAIRHRHTLRYKLTGLTMTLSFFLARPVFIPAFMVWMFSKPYLTAHVERGKLRVALIVGGITTAILYALNCYWFGLMWKGLKRALRATKRGESWDVVEEVAEANGIGAVIGNTENGNGVYREDSRADVEDRIGTRNNMPLSTSSTTRRRPVETRA